MSERLTKLLQISSPAIASAPSKDELRSLAASEPVLKQLCALLSDKNGFFAFESALLVRPLSYENQPFGITQWNKSDLWKDQYKIDLRHIICFAEDVFGTQFCVKDSLVYSFDPETGRFRKIADSIEGWARWLLDKYQVTTAWPLARQWQTEYGPLEPGMRLLPKVPFVCNGKFSIENLYKLNDTEGMRFRASIANQLIDVPDGASVILKIDRK